METKQLESPSTATHTSQQADGAAVRLVIRVKIPDPSSSSAGPPRLNRRAVVLAVGASSVLALLTWIGIDLLRTEVPAPPSSGIESADVVDSRSARVIASANQASTDVPPPKAAASSARTQNTNAQSASAIRESSSVPSTTSQIPDPPPSPVTEVIPDASRSALQTIRGTIRVLVRVTINKDGTVIAATSEVPGPSRYFERLSHDAAKKWTFTPALIAEERTMLLRFHFTREGATASATSP